jgi:hypothetical protein
MPSSRPSAARTLVPAGAPAKVSVTGRGAGGAVGALALPLPEPAGTVGVTTAAALPGGRA